MTDIFREFDARRPEHPEAGGGRAILYIIISVIILGIIYYFASESQTPLDRNTPDCAQNYVQVTINNKTVCLYGYNPKTTLIID